MKKETKRTKWVHIRLTEEEYNSLHRQFKTSTCRKLSDYSRSVIFGKPIISGYRNKSMDDFMAGMMKLLSELNSIGNNFNQLVRKVNTYKEDEIILKLLTGSESQRKELLLHIETIQLFIEKNAELW